jgi:hypothetical protein
MTYKSMVHKAPRQTTFQNRWPFSADTDLEIKNIYVINLFSSHTIALSVKIPISETDT